MAQLRFDLIEILDLPQEPGGKFGFMIFRLEKFASDVCPAADEFDVFSLLVIGFVSLVAIALEDAAKGLPGCLKQALEAGGGAKNDDVTAFRHVLVEFDRDEVGKEIPKEEQYHAIVASGMPVAALMDSGNKSLHAWIRVDAPDEKEYKRRVEIIWGWFSGINLDKQNRNASRLSRCPDGWRTVDGNARGLARRPDS